MQCATNNDSKVDVLINVFSKPYQTALSLLTLLRHSGEHIDKIYFHEERYVSEFERKRHEPLLEYLGARVVYYLLPEWLSSNVIDEKRLKEDPDYRFSIRYQYGWEQTDKKFVLLVHNDIQVTCDIVGEFLDNIGEATAIGEIGQCWWCPAGQNGLCSSERYTEYRPSYDELMRIYNENMDYTQRRAYNLGLREEMRADPWPLPECRVNEWSMLVNMEKARSVTHPFGPAVPLGAFFASGSKIGENWDEDVSLDTGVQWFRQLNLMGHNFADYPIENCIIHDRRGRVALLTPEKYVLNEISAKNKLMKDFPEFFKLIG